MKKQIIIMASAIGLIGCASNDMDHRRTERDSDMNRTYSRESVVTDPAGAEMRRNSGDLHRDTSTSINSIESSTAVPTRPEYDSAGGLRTNKDNDAVLPKEDSAIQDSSATKSKDTGDTSDTKPESSEQ